MKRNSGKRLISVLTALALLLFLCGSAGAENYSASTMRLLHYEGTVEIEDAGGAPRFVMENVRFSSGEAMRTGEASLASVGLDESKIVTLDEKSRVEFFQEGNTMRLKLTEGQLLLDVQEKLDENESLDIETSTMVVGIRGTIVFVSDQPAADGTEGAARMTTLGVLEGTAHVTYQDESGQKRTLPVEAGQKLVIPDVNGNGQADAESGSGAMTAADIQGFVQEQVEASPVLQNRVENASDVLQNEDGLAAADPFPAAGDWTWNGPVTLVAQSASKLYDGQPLTRPGDVLVYGLPVEFSIQVAASGSQTDAGRSVNRVSSYGIYNQRGENVTAHFSRIETVDGQLIVDPAPLTVWTGSAEKVYDGEPLTNPEVELRTVPGYEKDMTPWRNTSYVSASVNDSSETLYGISGVTWVHGTNPLTGETREIVVYAGQKLTVNLHSEENSESIEFTIETVTEEELPEEILRLYADNPDLLAQACEDTGWNPKQIAKRIAELPEEDGNKETRRGLKVSAEAAGNLMTDSTNVKIHIDTEITSYNDRALNGDEARFTPILLDESIRATATGSQTEVGESLNTYEIDWGNVNPSNYILSEELGTLTVLEAEVIPPKPTEKPTPTPKPTEEPTSTPEPTEEPTPTPEPTEEPTPTPEPTEEPTPEPTEEPTPEPTYEDAVTFTGKSAEKTYDGTALTGDVEVSGLPTGFTGNATAGGSQTDAGSSDNMVTSWQILDASGADVSSRFTNVSTVAGTLTVNPAPVTVFTGSDSKTYDGTPLVCSADARIEGMVAGDTATVTATGTITNVGTAENGYTIDWGTASASNYTVTENLGTLEVVAAEIQLTAASAEKVYDGGPLTNSLVTAVGLPSEHVCSATASGSQTDVGEAVNEVDSGYMIRNADGTDVTACFAVSTVNGILKVEAQKLTVDLGEGDFDYNGEIQLPVPSVTYTNGPFEGNTETCDLSGDAGMFECSLANGETMVLTVSGAERNTGEYTLSGSSELGSSGNYEIVYQAGKSVINPCYVEITLGGTFPYQEGVTYYPEIQSAIPQGEVLPVSTSWGKVSEGKAQLTFNWGSAVDVIEIQINISKTVEAGGDGDYPIPEGSASVIPNDNSGNYACYFPASMMTISEPEGIDIGG